MARAGKKASNVVVWVILALLVFALGGFGIGNFGGGVRTIGAVGDSEIDVETYGRALQTELRNRQAATGRAVSLNTPEGQALAEAVRRQLLGTAALDGETARLGISAGDEAVREQLLSIPAFQGLDGQFDRAAYAETLRRNGLSEDDFEARLRSELGRTLTTAAVVGGTAGHETMVAALAAYVGERRDISWLRLDAAALPEPVPAPTEDALRAHYEANPEAFTAPERKEITYVLLTPEMMVEGIAVDEAELRARYAERAAEFNRPERRLVERLVFPDAAAAEAARAALDAGETGFEALVAARGLKLSDVDLGDVTQAELGGAGAALFALAEPGIAGPVPTDLGPALFRVNAILAAQTTPFEDVRDDLTDEVALDRARREIAALRESIDDLLAGGATLEEVAAETEMELGTIALAAGETEGVAGYAAFRDAADAVTEEDFPEVLELEDGGIFALRLDAVRAPELEPFERVRDEVAASWTDAEAGRQVKALADEIVAALAAGQTLADLGHSPEQRSDVARESFIDGVPPGMIGTAFGLAEGAAGAIASGSEAFVVIVDRIVPAATDSPETVAISGVIADQLGQGIAQDLLDLFVSALEAEAGISLNPTAINAVHSQFP